MTAAMAEFKVTLKVMRLESLQLQLETVFRIGTTSSVPEQSSDRRERSGLFGVSNDVL